MRSDVTFPLACLLVAAGIALGAFGAHGLRDVVAPALLVTWETGVRYHLYAALALLVLGVRAEQRWAPLLLVAGLVVFSGSLYLMALTGARWLGAITPGGGVLLIVGMIWAAWDARRAGRVS